MIARFLRRLIVLSALCALCSASRVAAELPQEIRVITYNIHHGEGTDGKIDLERIAKLLMAEKPDIVALNEVDQGVERTHGIDTPAEMDRLTGMTAVFEKNIDYQGGKYGNAILTRLPVRRHENHKLPSDYKGEQRGVLEVELGDADEKEPLLFFATHLDYRPANHERLASVPRIKEIIGNRTKQLAILAGDLNDAPDSQVLAEFAKHWKITTDQPLPSFPSDKPNRQIDFILVRPADRWKVVETRVIEEKVASDHRPLLAVLEQLEK
jgi:endonuclease/exonuclease/phosphatase family metal-dependent hydrolase